MKELFKNVANTAMMLLVAVVFSTSIIKSCQQARAITVYAKDGAIIVQPCNAEITVLDALAAKELDE